MNEIDLKKTPLSEIDLNRIDYEKSYIDAWNRDPRKRSLKNGKIESKSFRYEITDSHGEIHFFNLEGKCWFLGDKTLHLFYKEEKVQNCYNCYYSIQKNRCNTYHDACYNCCIGNLFTNWKPKESVKEEKGCGNCQYICTLPYNDPCCKCDTINHPFWQPKEVKERPAGEWKQVNSHPIIIEYQDLGDKVKIVKIEGVMTHDEIQKHANHSVYLEYFGGMHMFMSANKKELILVTKSIPVTTKYDIGCTISKMRFGALINFMKLSAKRLAELIKESKTIKRIEI